MFIIFSIHQIKLRTWVQGGQGQCVRIAYTGEGGGVKNWQNFAYVPYGWPLTDWVSIKIICFELFHTVTVGSIFGQFTSI